jgi:hypothetical protein
LQGPVGCREDLGFEPEGGGSHGGLWAGEGGPGLAHRVPWWLLWGRHTGETGDQGLSPFWSPQRQECRDSGPLIGVEQ